MSIVSGPGDRSSNLRVVCKSCTATYETEMTSDEFNAVAVPIYTFRCLRCGEESSYARSELESGTAS